jgi:hypothetical protein
MRLPGMKGLALANRLGLLTALPMLSWLLPTPYFSKAVFRPMERRCPASPTSARPPLA